MSHLSNAAAAAQPLIPPIRENQIALSRSILQESQSVTFPYVVEICGECFEVHEGVFSPRFFHSTPLFTTWLCQEQLGDFLEVGCGIGATSILVAKRKAAAHVTAVDINLRAVANTAANALRHGLGSQIECLESDVFSGLALGAAFDSIYWNTPFIWAPADYQYRSELERSLFDPDYRYTERFLREAHRLLRPHGRLFVGFGDFGEWRLLRSLAEQTGWHLYKRRAEPSTEGQPVTFELLELHRNA